MMVADTMIAAVAAVGGLGGLAALISAVRPPAPGPVQPSGAPSHVPGSWRRVQDAHARTAKVPASRAVFWSLAPGACACLLAGALVTVVGTTTLSLSQPPIVVLIMATAACAALTIWVSGRLLWRGAGQGRADLALYAGAGLVIAFAALAATFIAGSG
jgi:hypothetical protein